MNQSKYSSYLICDHADITAYYVNGLEAAIYHKDTDVLEVKHKDRMAQLNNYLAANLGKIQRA